MKCTFSGCSAKSIAGVEELIAASHPWGRLPGKWVVSCAEHRNWATLLAMPPRYRELKNFELES
jgi:hypothetical protein